MPASRRWSRRKPCRRIGWAWNSVVQRRAVDLVGLGAEVVERRLGLGVAVDGPHAGLALGAGLGEQQRPAVVEAPAGDAAPGLGRLLLVGLEPPALHQVHDERHHADVEQQVLAPPADEHDGLADGVGGIGPVRLEGGERDRREPLEHGAGEGGVEPLGVGLDLGELGHAASGPEGGERAGGVGQEVEAAPHPQPAVDERLLGRQLAAADGRRRGRGPR